ncbi:Cell division control protein 11 [Dimargaris cristalligena]|uniref:Septin-type guanine nucleotide-binding (G) domain-containing protein n=1 Tax=Dimargaris cristalligena TaxID=215637 RepID=A0A4P9ZYD7_9FUNG|nr:Cell division control protein 11 [Dimargaris cristalligena]RKP37780.1 Septin-type guanine nucleotide-binding (G) domain-containing protein [Dimargaris cristalligena]|eukprot:RKP37780.1 Septin-type guanine nucleotide-binding (G) domain-containing protein [Dimargaris cristalligena]
MPIFPYNSLPKSPTFHFEKFQSYNSHQTRPGSHRWKNAKKGLQFTVMTVGCPGLGRTTFINTLCEKSVLPAVEVGSPETAHEEQPMTFKPYNVEMEEDGIKIAFTVIDTPGFGNGVNNEEHFKQIVHYLESRYEETLAEETRIKRNPKFKDNRVHALLYFITPTGHGLRELDIKLMKRVGNRVNVIPIIAKSDSLTVNELRDFKKRVMEDIDQFRIPIYNFPYDAEEDDEETVEENKELRNLLPFAIVGCEEEVMHDDGSLLRVRNYPWGRVEIDNTEHCDFARLRFMLLNSHLSDLKEITHDILYENYRTEKLSDEQTGEPMAVDA